MVQGGRSDLASNAAVATLEMVIDPLGYTAGVVAGVVSGACVVGIEPGFG